MYGFTSFSEVPFATLNTMFGDVTESLSLADLQNITAQFAGSVTESIVLTDTQQGVVDYFPVNVVEDLTLTPLDNTSALFSGSVDEVVSLSQSQDVVAAFVGVTQEGLVLTDLESVQAFFVVARNESMTLTDAQNVTVVFVGNAAETLSLTESQTSRAAFLATCLEQLGLSDTPCAFGWFGIPDENIPDWGVIEINVQETASYGAFTFGGVPFAGTYTISGVGPNPIPLPQNANWQEIDNIESTDWSLVNNEQNC